MTMTDILMDEAAKATAYIAQQARDAELAPEPGERAGDTTHEPSHDEPWGTVISEVTSSGHVLVWNIKTRESSVVTRNNLTRVLAKKGPDGKYVFTSDRPAEPPIRGKMLCMLHEDHPERPYYKSLGLPSCRKSNLVNAFHVRRHMQSKHKGEWGSIQEEEQKQIADEERQVRRAIIAQNNPVAPPETPTAPLPPAASVQTPKASRPKTDCKKCGEVIRAKTERGLKMKVTNHMKVCPQG